SVGTDLNGCGNRRLVRQVPGVVLDVHHARVDLGRVRRPQAIVEALPTAGPARASSGAGAGGTRRSGDGTRRSSSPQERLTCASATGAPKARARIRGL